MSLDFLRDNTDIINKGAVRRDAPFDMANRGASRTTNSPLVARQQPRPTQRRVVKIYANNEKDIVDLITKALIKNPKLVKPISRGLSHGLQALQKDLTQRGYLVDIVKAYKASQNANKLVGRLLAFVAKGVVTVGNEKPQISAQRGRAIKRIQLISASEAHTPSFTKIGRFSGVYGNRPAIYRFRISAINELGNQLGIESSLAFKVLARQYNADDYCDNNDLTQTTNFNISSLTDDEIADCIECGAYSKDEIRAMIDPAQAKRVTHILQKRVAL